METVLASLITGALALAGVMLTNAQAGERTRSQLERNQAVTDTKLDALAREVREHNNFARRIPVVEEQLSSLRGRVEKLEKEERKC